MYIVYDNDMRLEVFNSSLEAEETFRRWMSQKAKDTGLNQEIGMNRGRVGDYRIEMRRVLIKEK